MTKEIKSKAMFVALILASSMSTASTWNTYSRAYNDESIFFFDADTVSRSGENVTIWTKYVKTKSPDSDGSWATAQRMIINCSKRTTQTLTSSVYERDGKFMKTFPQAGRVIEVVPDSISEEILKTSCASDFPKNQSKKNYFPVKNNDVFEFTKNFVDYLDSLKDTAPK